MDSRVFVSYIAIALAVRCYINLQLLLLHLSGSLALALALSLIVSCAISILSVDRVLTHQAISARFHIEHLAACSRTIQARSTLLSPRWLLQQTNAQQQFAHYQAAIEAYNLEPSPTLNLLLRHKFGNIHNDAAENHPRLALHHGYAKRSISARECAIVHTTRYWVNQKLSLLSWLGRRTSSRRHTIPPASLARDW
jgi:hypothetical protein